MLILKKINKISNPNSKIHNIYIQKIYSSMISKHCNLNSTIYMPKLSNRKIYSMLEILSMGN